MIQKACKVCGKYFSIPAAWVRKGGGSYCSGKCRGIAQNKKLQSVCVVCGNDFLYSPSRPTNVCGWACRVKNKQVTKVCTVCGKSFTIAKSNASRYNTCSISCTRRDTIYGMKCKECGKELKPGRDKFCSKTCYRKHTGETSPEKNVRLCLEYLSIEYIQEHTFDGWKYPVDFFLPILNIVIEVDGEYWHSKQSVKDRDKRKTDWLVSKGHKVFRISDKPFYGKVTSEMIETLEKLIS